MNGARKIDDKRLGLLARMLGFDVAIFTKRVAAPLLRRGFIKLQREMTYELTPIGQRFALEEIERRKRSKKAKVTTWSGTAIGHAVFIVNESDKS